LSDGVFASVDLFFGEIKNFVTDLLPCVNDQFPCYSLTDEVNVPQNFDDVSDRIDLLESQSQLTPAEAAALRSQLGTLRVGYGAIDRQLSPFLATLPTGSRTAVVSYANAGRVLEYGAEFGIGARLADEWHVDASYGYIKVVVREAPIDELIPNSPSHRGSLGVMYQGRQGFDGSITFRFSTGHEWVAGVFLGWVPSRQTFDMNLGYVINNNVRVFLSGLNILDQQRFQMYGGSVIGRRILAGVTTTF
jgi:outer membrane receptor protein involved in Fe transport